MPGKEAGFRDAEQQACGIELEWSVHQRGER